MVQILSDSALPIGSFAFSSGLESFVKHGHGRDQLETFIAYSLLSLGTSSIPFVRAAYLEPQNALDLDNEYDATVTCPVARRASVAQGRSLVTLWYRSFRRKDKDDDISMAIDKFKRENGQQYPVAWGIVLRNLDISLNLVLITFMLNHAKALISAAVRQGVIGPYGGQELLASPWLSKSINRVLEYCSSIAVHETFQSVPMMDIWQGRHDLLYSRIFNS